MSSEPKIYDLETYQPANCVGQLMYRVRAAHMSALDEVLAKDPDLAPLEISAAQYVVISVLAKSKCVDSAAQLCKDLSYDAGAMTRMVDRLEAKGLISRRRCPDDRRLVKLELTEAGLGGVAEAAGMLGAGAQSLPAWLHPGGSAPVRELFGPDVTKHLIFLA